MEAIPFDEIINRKGTDCSKWDHLPYEVQGTDILPMWVADMDFACPPAVLEPVHRRLAHPVFGYMQLPQDYHSSIVHWQQTRYGAQVAPQDIVPVASVLGGVAMAVQALTQKGDAIMVPTPGYLAFYNAVVHNERTLVENPMRRNGDVYEIDFVRMEQQMAEQNVKLLLWCSPHNPTGRIWTKEELARVVALCLRYKIPLISDEIHADMTLTHPFTTIFSAHPRAKDIAIGLYAPTKTFNIAGLCTAFAIIKNQALADAFNHAVLACGLKVKNTLGVSALIGGYQNGAPWVDALQTYLLESAQYAVAFINQNIPGVHAYVPQATYFLWIDFAGTGLSADEIIQKCVYEAHVAIYRGTQFIAGGETFVRMNYACPRSILQEALTRLHNAFTTKGSAL